MKKQTPETAIKKEIKDWLRLKGWFAFHIQQGLGAYKGIPDLIACKMGKVLFIEVKTEKGKQSEYQYEFEMNLHKQYCHYILARSYKDVEKYIKDQLVQL